MNSRALNGEFFANSCENFTFQGQTDWEMCRYTRTEIHLSTGLHGKPRTMDESFGWGLERVLDAIHSSLHSA